MNAAPAATPEISPLIEAETPVDAMAIDALVLAAFGPGRFAKTAERLREASALLAGFVGRRDGRLIGSVRLWSIRAGDARAAFLGPIAVEASSRSGGLGAELVQACVDHARAGDLDGVLLVGDPPYFSRFGFVAAPGAMLPGPVDQRRVMWLPLTDVAPIGPVRPSSCTVQ